MHKKDPYSKTGVSTTYAVVVTFSTIYFISKSQLTKAVLVAVQ